MSVQRHPLTKLLGYEFADPGLLRQALTHRSAGEPHNERMEYLGDALLGFLVAEHLYRLYPTADEGQLTRTRASLVNRDSLARVARTLDLGTHLILGEGEMKSGGWRRDSILSNAFEAIFGAIYLDGGMARCRMMVAEFFAEALASPALESVLKDPKTRLQEYLQGRHLPLPRYQLLRQDGEPHEQRFTVECTVEGVAEAIVAEGASRRRAEQCVAEKALDLLKVRFDRSVAGGS